MFLYFKINSTEIIIYTVFKKQINLTPMIEYRITVTAYNQMGESAPSNEVLYMLPAFTPGENPSSVIHIPGPVTIIVE